MDKIFLELECLTEYSKPLSGKFLRKNWFKKADKRYISLYLQKFIEYNRSNFNFLGVNVFIEGTDPNTSLRFRTSEYIGVIPLRSPDTGKQIGDFIVSPRYSSKTRLTDYIKILNLINKSVNVIFKNSIPLISGKNFQPPFYYEAILYIKLLTYLVQDNWMKFAQTEKNNSVPIGNVNWNKYLMNDFKVEKRLKFPVRKNILTEYHNEYANLKYVFSICKQELLGPNTPEEIKLSIKSKLYFIEEKLKFHQIVSTNTIHIKQSDSRLVKDIKVKANNILQKNYSKSTAWKVDFNEVFEKYVQFIFNELSTIIGGKFYSNYKIRAFSNRKYEWELKYLEPDGIYRKGDSLIIFVDAKYKSHLLNKYSQSEHLKIDFRSDLHQIIGYTSFSSQQVKNGFLCYPSNIPEIKETKFINPITQSETVINFIGIPLNVNDLIKVKKIILSKINSLEYNQRNFDAL